MHDDEQKQSRDQFRLGLGIATVAILSFALLAVFLPDTATILAQHATGKLVIPAPR